MKEEKRKIIPRMIPKNESELKSSLLPHPAEFDSIYSRNIDRHIPLASIADDFMIMIIEKQKALVEAPFMDMARKDNRLRKLADWFSFRITNTLLLTRAKDGMERFSWL